MEFLALKPVPLDTFAARWAAAMPADLELIDCRSLPVSLPGLSQRLQSCQYLVRFEQPALREQLPELLGRGKKPESLVFVRRKKGREIILDFVPHLQAVEMPDDSSLLVTLKVVDGRNPNIYDVISALLGSSGERITDGYTVIKQRSCLLEPDCEEDVCQPNC